MENVLLLDTSVASLNRGDDIIMECINEELKFYTDDKFILTLPTHVPAFHSYQVLKNSYRVQIYKECYRKFVCGTNLLVPNMFTHFSQWNINIFNYKALKNSILIGVGMGAGDKTNYYTTLLYKKLLNKNIYHSVRDERTKMYLNNIGIKAINTGCPTMWKLTSEFCKTIPKEKSDSVIFTLTPKGEGDDLDQILIDTLKLKYKKIYFWIQGIRDFEYLSKFKNISDIIIISPLLSEYRKVLENNKLDYVGTRLHAGVYAMRNGKRTIIIAIDERAREINKCNNLNCIEMKDVKSIGKIIDSNFETKINMPYKNIEAWKKQFV